jgi:hypothetical protein
MGFLGMLRFIATPLY